MATPAASAQAALVFANTEWVETKQAYIAGYIFAVISMVVIVCLVYPLGAMLF